jgi:hypothetical protein
VLKRVTETKMFCGLGAWTNAPKKTAPMTPPMMMRAVADVINMFYNCNIFVIYSLREILLTTTFGNFCNVLQIHEFLLS